MGQNLDRARKIDLALLHHHFDAGMFQIGGTEHRRAFVRLVDGIFFGDRHRGDDAAIVGIKQRDIAASLDGIGGERDPWKG